MPHARSHECCGVIGNFKTCNIVFINHRLHLMGHDVAASIGKTRCMVGQEKAFSKLIKSMVKEKKSMSTHRNTMYSALQVL